MESDNWISPSAGHVVTSIARICVLQPYAVCSPVQAYHHVYYILSPWMCCAAVPCAMICLVEEFIAFQKKHAVRLEHATLCYQVGRVLADTATGDYRRAAEVFDECLKLREEILGLDYPDTRMAAQALQRCRDTAMVNLDKASRERVDNALWSAAAAGNASLVEKMLKAGACPDIERDGLSALCIATLNGHVDAVMLLCEGGADPDAVATADGDVCGATAMSLAAIGGNATIIDLLIEAGGTVDAVLPQNGCTPLYMAADNGYVDVVQALLAAGADLHRTSATGASCVCAAARSGQSAVILVLANAGADLDLPMNNGATPAHLAAMAGQSEALVTLHTLGADVEKAVLVRGEEQTPLKLAQQYGQIEASEILNNLVSATYHIVMLQARVRGKRRRRELEKLKAEQT